MPSGYFYNNSKDPAVHFQYKGRQVSFFFIIILYIGIPVFNANSADPDQTPRFAPLFANVLFWGTMHKWV